jgi:hypothetical protein
MPRAPLVSPFLLLLATVLAACATMTGEREVQRALEGPRAQDVWMQRFAQAYGRVPSFVETATWRDALDAKVADYLGKRPDILTSPRASQFRFRRQVFAGMTKEEVGLLLEQPEAVTTEEAAMSEAARQFWPQIKPRAREMWVYPGGWHLYFAADHLVDMVVLGQQPIER